MKESNNQFCRCDGFNPSVKCDDPIQEKWIHKQIVKKTGDSEDDFIIEEKPVLLESVNIQKSIQEEAKTTDLKYLLKQFLMTGDESFINSQPGFYGDVTGVQALMSGKVLPSAEQIKSTLPVELQVLTTEQLASMSDEDILKHIAKVREMVKTQAAKQTTEKQTSEKKGESE